MGKTAATSDVILDFTVGDDIDLSTIDATGALAGHTFSFLALKGAAFTGAAGQLRWFTQGTGSSAVTIVEGTINADKVADFQIQLAGTKTLTVGDFIL
jgi:serralysin